MTFDQFLKEGRQDNAYHGPLIFPSPTPPPPTSKSRHYTNYATLPPSAEPVTMQPITSALASSFLAGTDGTASLDLKGSDGRLEVQLQPGSLDLTHATVSGGSAPVGALSVHLVQLHGHTLGQKSVLGTYQVQFVDSQSHTANGIVLHAPVSIIYHYQPSELAGLGLDPGNVVLSWPTLIAAALKAKQPTTGLSIPMHNDPLAHTLTAQSMVLDASPFTATGTPANQSLTALHLASVQGNSGQSSYSYPLQVPPGTGGFTPHLTLAYSSAGPNERHNATSPAGNEGDGWSLNMGSISAEVYPGSPNTTWYFLNNVANVGDRLIPSTGNSFDTEHISYLKIQQVTANNQPCFHVWDKAGTPTVKDGNGNITDDRFDALFCTNNSTCTGNYAHPDDHAWSEQVVTSITTLGTDSSNSSLLPAKITYGYYRLAHTGWYDGHSIWCTPDQYPGGETDCVGDNWLPAGDGDWQDYYHAEYQGFAQVWTVSPANDLTVDYYNSTEGWNTPMSDPPNYLGGMLYQEEVYWGTSYDATKMLTRTNTTYPIDSTPCKSVLATYPACELVVLSTKATDYEGTNSSSAPWVQHSYTYDDYGQYGLQGGYHVLLADSMTTSNSHGSYRQWSYSNNDQTVGTWIYYTVGKVSHSEIDDDSSHIWQCQDTTYDEGAPSGAKTPSQGLPTTVKTYSNSACTPTRGTALTTSYQGYDAYGNAVESVDALAAANSSLYASNGCTLATAPHHE